MDNLRRPFRPRGAWLAAAAAAAAAALAQSASALEWPLPGTGLALNFGYTAKGSVSFGMEFAPTEQPVKAFADGEVIFRSASGTLPNGFSLVGRETTIVSHPQDIVTVSSGYLPGSVPSALRLVKEGAEIGRPGPGGLRFFVVDRVKRRFVNPFVLLPPLVDKKPPAIKSLRLFPSADPANPALLGETKRLRQGSYEAVVDVTDAWGDLTNFAPFEVRFLIDGRQESRFVFDSSRSVEGLPAFSAEGARAPAYPFRKDDRLSLGTVELKSGKVLFTVSARDYAGNGRDASYSILVD